MSDDGYYYDDAEYEDFQDMLYDADPAPELADDLAERAAYSPIWQDNPAEELRDYFSDWEYYSDDYWDDDPNLLRPDGRGGQQRGGGLRKHVPGARGKKRKLSEARERPSIIEQQSVDALAACLRGTVWKHDSPDRTTIYSKGVHGTVALTLSDDIMKQAYNRRHGFGKGKVGKDESWANDLSLADMGLTAERTMSMQEQSQMNAEEAGDADDVGVMDMDAMLADGEALDDDMIKEVVRLANSRIKQGHNVMEDMPPDTPDEEQASRKRRKLVRMDEISERNVHHENSRDTATATKVEGVQDPTSTCAVTQEELHGIPKESGLEIEDRATAAPVEGDLISKHRGRKRQLSASHSKATESTASSRAKRQDTKKSEPDDKSTVKTAAAFRPSRSRKK